MLYKRNAHTVCNSACTFYEYPFNSACNFVKVHILHLTPLPLEKFQWTRIYIYYNRRKTEMSIRTGNIMYARQYCHHLIETRAIIQYDHVLMPHIEGKLYMSEKNQYK